MEGNCGGAYREAMITVVVCETSVVFDKMSKEVCVGAKCIKCETEEQFRVVYNIIMAIAEFCGKRMMMRRSER